MIYLKCALTGLLAIVAATVVVPVVGIVGIVLYTAIHSSQKGSVGWDPISLIHPSLLILTLVAFCFTAGFFWQFRRLARR